MSIQPFSHEYKKTSRGKETWKRIKLCLSNKSHIALLDTLSNENTKLKSLVKDCIELEPVRAKSSLCSGIPWVSLRHCSLSLYDAMATRWCCDCQYPHHALFRLELRNDAQVDAFNLSFLRDFDPATGHSAVRKFECHSMEIDALELDERCVKGWLSVDFHPMRLLTNSQWRKCKSQIQEQFFA